jgi:uncharacterized protein involved in exopolysaccharide biosynthesis
MQEAYQSTAYVMIVKPSTIVNFDGGIESSPQLPDAKSMTDLTLADDLIDGVLQDQEVSTLFSDPISHGVFRSKLKSTLVGGNQLRLEVVDTNPERAAIIANVWAREVAARFNALFGSGSAELEQIGSQAEQAQQAWDAAEQELLGHLENSNLESQQITLEQQKLALSALVAKVEEIDVLISDAQNMLTQLEDQAASESLSLEDTLSLLTLSQQASGQIENFQVQIGADLIPSQETTVADARKGLTSLIGALEQQKTELDDTGKLKSSLITDLAAKLEAERYNVDQLTLQRDLNREAYDALSTHLVELQIMSANSDQIAKVAGEAMPPSGPFSPSTKTNLVIAAGVGFILVVGFVLVWDWWKSPKKGDVAQSRN